MPKKLQDEHGRPYRYWVTWEIDIEDVDSPEEAAARALIIQRDSDPANGATVFKVSWMNRHRKPSGKIREEFKTRSITLSS